MTDTTKYQAEAAAVAEVAAEPALFALDGDDRDRQIAMYPPGWSMQIVETHQEPIDAKRMEAHERFYTAEGWAAEMKRLSGKRTPVVRAAGLIAIIGHPDPTSVDAPTFDQVKVDLQPERSVELASWANAVGMNIAQWERHIENTQADIDAAASDPKAPSYLDILADARSWKTESKRVVRITKGDNGLDEEAVDEIKVKALGEVLRSFQISVPVFRFGPNVQLTVVVDRDIDKMTVSARIPGLDRLEQALRNEMFESAAGLGGWTILR